MKNHVRSRPIGKCKGCCLNMRTFCAAGLEPKREWSKGRCRSWSDASLLERFYCPVPVTGAKAAKVVRRARALVTATKSHYNGRIIPARYVSAARSQA